MDTDPSLDLHNRLIAAFLDPAATLSAIAAQAGLTLCQLAQWFAHPGTQAALEELREMARFRAQLLADLGLPAAVQNLERLTAQLAQLEPEPDAPITLYLRLADTARRNATAIQRLGTPRAARGIAIPAIPADTEMPRSPRPFRTDPLETDPLHASQPKIDTARDAPALAPAQAAA